MVFIGAALAGGILAGGIVTGGALAVGGYRARQPKPTLASVLASNGGARANGATGPMAYSVAPRTLALGGLAAGGSLLLLASANGLTPLVLANEFVTLLQGSRYAPLLFIAADAVRPLTFFPDTLMTIASGLLFGPMQGLLISFVGMNASALVAYNVGRKLRPASASSAKEDDTDVRESVSLADDAMAGKGRVRQILQRYGEQMQKHPFASMLFMHAAFLHYDIVNYTAGYLGLPWRPYLLGTLLGTLPWMSAGVLAGASLHGVASGGALLLNPVPLVASGVLLVGGLGVATYLNRRQKHLSEGESIAIDFPAIDAGFASTP